MRVTQEQIDALHTPLVGELAVHLYTEYVGADNADVVFQTLPGVLRQLAEAFEEAIEERDNEPS